MKVFEFLKYLGIGLVLDFFSAIILSLYWKWFLIPVFSLQPIGILHSYGIILTISLFTYWNGQLEDIDAALLNKFTRQISALVIGFLFSLCL